MILLGSQRRRVSNLAIFVIIILFSKIDYNYFTHPTKLPFREMSKYVNSTRTEDDFLINWNAGAHHLWETKYYGFDSPIYIPDGGNLPYFVGTALMEKEDIVREIPSTASRVGVTTSGSVENIKLPGYEEDKRMEMDNLKFVWYRKTN